MALILNLKYLFSILLCIWQRQRNPDYDNDLQLFLPRKVVLRRSQMTDTVGTC